MISQYLVKKAGSGLLNSALRRGKKVVDWIIGESGTQRRAATLGGMANAELASNFRAWAGADGNGWFQSSEDKPTWVSFLPATVQGIANPETRREYILGTVLSGGTGAGICAQMRAPGRLPGSNIKLGVLGTTAGTVEGLLTGGFNAWTNTLKSERAYYDAQTAALKAGDKEQPIVVNVDAGSNNDTNAIIDTNITKEETTSDKVFNYGSVLLGLAGLGLGGYALYKSLTENKAKAKVKLKGKVDDPYDDVEVELPMDQLNVSNTMGRRVNTSVRKTIHESNKFNSRKKDKETGKLISYEEYLGKYGDPDKSKENVLQPLEKASSYMEPEPITKKKLKRMKEKYDKTLINKGIGMGIGALLGGAGGYVFGSQAFNGPYPSDYSPGIVNTVGGIGGVLGGGLLGGYLADKFSEN